MAKVQSRVDSDAGSSATGSEPRAAGGAFDPEVTRVLDVVERHLKEGHTEPALEAIRRTGAQSAWLTNAAGVCRLRQGHPSPAAAAFRGLAATDGIWLRKEAPAAFKVNLAAALLAEGNLAGFKAILKQLRDDEHPAVATYRSAYRAWRRNLTFGQRIRYALTGQANPPLRPDFPLGELR